MKSRCSIKKLCSCSEHLLGGLALIAFSFALLCGCADTRGPDLVVNSHIDYNKAISQVLRDELLLNVVRRRYGEAPQFVNVSSISSRFETSTTISASSVIGDIGRADVVDTTVDGSLKFSDSPTITLTPRQGEDIATQLHEPLSVSVVADLVAAGYTPYGAFNLLVEGVNNLRGPDLQYKRYLPGSAEWNEAMTLVEEFYEDGSLLVDRFRWNDPYGSYAYSADAISPELWVTTLTSGARRWKSYDGGKTFVFTTHEMAPAIWLDAEVRQTSEGQRLMELLNVQPEVQQRIWIMEPARVADGPDLAGKPDEPRSTLKLRMRSLYNVLNFYSFGVQVPPEHEETGMATDLSSFRAAVARSEIVDLKEDFAVLYSESRPRDAFQAVRYRGLWFYIDDFDLRTKRGFNALYDLWQLSIKTPSSQGAPLTTIQVN